SSPSIHSFPTRRSSDLGKGGSESNRGRISKPALRFSIRDCASRESSRGQTGDSMVKSAAVLVLLVLFAIPVMAQDDYPRIQTSRSEEHTSELQSRFDLV